MHDAGKVVGGLVIGLGLVTFPIWYDAVGGAKGPQPELVTGTTEKACVEPTDWMRENHMDLLNQWRDRVVRGGETTYTASTGKAWEHLKLTGTCLKQCHTQKDKFCDRCHEYAGVTPYCFDCHVTPGGASALAAGPRTAGEVD